MFSNYFKSSKAKRRPKMKFGDSNNNGKENQGSAFESPPNARHRLSTLQRLETIVINGKRIPLNRVGYEYDAQGNIIEVAETFMITVADGRVVLPTDIGGESWTGLPVPRDRLGECLNPFGNHQVRCVYLGIDGVITDLGNILCDECKYQNYKQYRDALSLINRFLKTKNPIIY
jgi:hypothetical protein